MHPSADVFRLWRSSFQTAGIHIQCLLLTSDRMHLVWFVVTVGIVGCDTHVTLTSYPGRCIPIGQQLFINCTIHGDKDKENNDNLFIKKNDQRLSVITERTSSMISLNTTLRQHGIYYYTCCRKQCSDEGEFDRGIFEVGDESHDPLNFHCIIRNTRVSCSFEMHDSCVEWALSYHMSGESAIHKGTCTNSVRKSLLCVEPNDERQSYRSLTKRCQDRPKEIQTTCLLPDAVRDEQYQIHVERTSPFTKTSFQYNITTNVKIEEMGSLRSFKVNSTSSTTATLTWRFPNNPAYYRYGITCSISHSTAPSTTKRWESGKDVRYTIEQLKPFRSYTIRVRCRFTESQYWSQISTVQCSTQQDVPMYGPKGSPTSYSIYQNQNKTSTLAFYIKPPPSDTINGVLTGYELQVNTSLRVLTRRFPVTTTLMIEDIPDVTMGLYADVWSLTVVGKSRDSLHFNIDPTDVGFQRVDSVSVTEFSDRHHFLVRIQHNRIALSNTHLTYIYHWCETNGQDYDCNDRIVIYCTAHYDFAYSNESKKTIVIPMESQWNHSWVFGASVLSAGSTGGIRWEKCTLPYGWSNTSVSYSLTKKEQPLYALIALAPGILVMAAIFYFIRKKLTRDCATYDFELPGVEHVNQQRGPVHMEACESICRLEPVEEEPEETRSSEYSRLHPTGHGLPGEETRSSEYSRLHPTGHGVPGEETRSSEYNRLHPTGHGLPGEEMRSSEYNRLHPTGHGLPGEETRSSEYNRLHPTGHGVPGEETRSSEYNRLHPTGHGLPGEETRSSEYNRLHPTGHGLPGEEMRSSEYSRLHPTGHGLPGDSGVMSPFVGPNKRDDNAGRWTRVMFTNQLNNDKLSELQETANGTFLHFEYSRLHPGDNTGSSTAVSDNELCPSEDREACEKQDQQTEMRKPLNRRSSYVCIPGDTRCPSSTTTNKEEEPCTQSCESDDSVWVEFKAVP
ncbi:uncharacterized protein [Argopecten irradians]|uniref:uncharacterized protein n=1 Tax=Argopecten irradians TaxID=31199 RepID=UPI0037118AC5